MRTRQKMQTVLAIILLTFSVAMMMLANFAVAAPAPLHLPATTAFLDKVR